MLILNRSAGQGFILIDPVSGHKTEVMTKWGAGNRIQYAIKAPKEVRIIRNEKDGLQDARKQRI